MNNEKSPINWSNDDRDKLTAGIRKRMFDNYVKKNPDVMRLPIDIDTKAKILSDRLQKLSTAEYEKLEKQAFIDEFEEAMAAAPDEFEKLPDGKWKIKPNVLNSEFINT